MEKKVKGSIFKPFVKGIRANKTGIYQTILSDEDLNIINQRILDATWYPFETFKNCFLALAKVEAKNNTRIIERWGSNNGKVIVGRLYKNIYNHRDIETAFTIYSKLFKLWFNFGKQSNKIISENELHVIIEDFEPNFKLFYHVISGWIKGVFETYLQKMVIIIFLEKSWEHSEKTVLRITW